MIVNKPNNFFKTYTSKFLFFLMGMNCSLDKQEALIDYLCHETREKHKTPRIVSNQVALQAESTGSTTPEIADALSLARKKIALAISSTLTLRLDGSAILICNSRKGLKMTISKYLKHRLIQENADNGVITCWLQTHPHRSQSDCWQCLWRPLSTG